MKIGYLIREVRIFKNISQNELSRRTNFTQQKISQMELGIRGISLENLILLSCALGVCPKFFIRCGNYINIDCRACPIICDKCIYKNVRCKS